MHAVHSVHSVRRSHRCTARAAGTHAGEFELLVGPLLDAMEKSLEYAGVFGPLMILAVNNDRGNLRKARDAWQKLSEESPRRVPSRATRTHRRTAR